MISSLITKILKAYRSYYNVETTELLNEDSGSVEEGNIINAIFHMHSEKYVLSKKAQLYQMDTNEYTKFYYYEHLTSELFNKVMAEVYEWGFPQINPGPDHRSSYIGAIFLCDSYDNEALKLLKKYRRRKSFQFSLHGWMEVHTVLIDLRSESIYSNADGRSSKKFLKNILHPKKRRKLF